MAINLAELCPLVVWKAELVSDETEISKQCFECMVLYLAACSKIWEEMHGGITVKQKVTRIWWFGNFLAYLYCKKSVSSHTKTCMKGLGLDPHRNLRRNEKQMRLTTRDLLRNLLSERVNFQDIHRRPISFFWEFLSVETLPDWTEKHRESEFKVDGRKKMKRKSSGFSINKQEIEVNASL